MWEQQSGWHSKTSDDFSPLPDEVVSVAQAIKAAGLLDLGWNYINLDDCWGVRNDTTHEIMGDPTRFPEGMPAFIQKIHDLGFKWGTRKCLCASSQYSSFPPKVRPVHGLGRAGLPLALCGLLSIL